ncbi:MAG: bifunctional methylenetetrahydrofolate dehydrogenase/methenyltetrahydrofolate cyclohydrolase FolD [Clostridia bacterium]|nr:bifunctional methylenetetrahydrofolate dehydrogenase/methenyltetrahydrofolate cyclohydrolase FolD [Clostridia bacterium]
MLIYGKEVAAKTLEKITAETQIFCQKHGRKPTLAVIIVGEDPASQTYVRNKINGCKQVGFNSLSYEYADGTPQDEIIAQIKSLAEDDSVDGILVQLPLPKGYDEEKILANIPDSKDVDGFNASNIGCLCLNRPRTVSCTPLGVMHMLEYTGVDLTGKHAVVLGRSNTVGKPMAMLLLNANCTVTVCHSKTKNMAEITKQADILVVAIGKPKFVTADMVKDGAIVIDVGINRVDGKLCGDVDFDSVAPKTSFISPVPGGVGPMTISMLLYNTLMSAKSRENER